MNIAIFTITRDRLELTKKCFRSLDEKADYSYAHYILDNGSTDGTTQWLRKGIRFDTVIYSPVNMGIAVAMNTIKKIVPRCDLVVKMDNDVEILADRILHRFVQLYKHLEEPWILAANVKGLLRPPQPIGDQIHIYDSNPKNFVNLTITPAWIGGCFRVMPYNLFMAFEADESLPLAWGVDGQMHRWAEKKGIKMGYVNELEVLHDTKAQQEAYPEYWIRKLEEEKR